MGKLLENAQNKVKELVSAAPKGPLTTEEEYAIRNDYARIFLDSSELDDEV